MKMTALPLTLLVAVALVLAAVVSGAPAPQEGQVTQNDDGGSSYPTIPSLPTGYPSMPDGFPTIPSMPTGYPTIPSMPTGYPTIPGGDSGDQYQNIYKTCSEKGAEECQKEISGYVSGLGGGK